MKRLVASLLLPMMLAFASCNSAPNMPANTSASRGQTEADAPASSSETTLTPQAADTYCTSRYWGNRTYECNASARTDVEIAGLMHKRAKVYFTNSSDYSTTVGATYIFGNYYITVYGGSTANAKTQIEKQVRAAGYQWVTPSGYVHAEQRLKDVQPYAVSIGISNPNGPCPSCIQNVVETQQTPISWYPGYYW